MRLSKFIKLHEDSRVNLSQHVNKAYKRLGHHGTECKLQEHNLRYKHIKLSH